MRVTVYTLPSGKRVVRGLVIVDDVAADLFDVLPKGKGYGGLSGDELVDGEYDMSVETGRLSPTQN